MLQNRFCARDVEGLVLFGPSAKKTAAKWSPAQPVAEQAPKQSGKTF